MFDSAWCLATWALTSSIDRRLSGWLESANWRARSLLDGGITFMVSRASLILPVPLNEEIDKGWKGGVHEFF
jgi:hypothetical protein